MISSSPLHFTAETRIQDQIQQRLNPALFLAGGYGFYLACTGVTGATFYLSLAATLFTVRKIGAVFFGSIVYPASFFSVWPGEKESLLRIQERNIQLLKTKNYHIEPLVLHKSGTNYAALLITHPSTEKCKRFAIYALGNLMTMEDHLVDLALKNKAQGYNTLLINGPGVGQSSGWPTRYQMGACFEAGLQFLERVKKASHIVMNGFSLGNGMMSEAILQHDFREGQERGVKYLLVSDRSFSRLSEICQTFIGRTAKPLLFFAGLDLDGIQAAKKLSDLAISQVIIQHSDTDAATSDGVIPDRVSLASQLAKDLLLVKKQFLLSPEILHDRPLPPKIQSQLDRWIKGFV